MTPRGKQKTQWGICSVAHSTPLLGQQQSPLHHPSNPHQLFLAVQTSALARTLDVTRRPCYSARSIIHSPADELQCHVTPNEAALLWDSCQLFFLLLSRLFLRLKNRWKGLHSHCTVTEGARSFFKRSYIHYRILIRERRRVRVHTAISNEMSRKMYVQCVCGLTIYNESFLPS